MTPKEKAEELVEKFLEIEFQRGRLEFDGYLTIEVFEAKQCAFIAVDEILKSHHNLYGVNNKQVKFYLEVEQEIEKL